jgi:Ni,Fe-hydrogenase III component G
MDARDGTLENSISSQLFAHMLASTMLILARRAERVLRYFLGFQPKFFINFFANRRVLIEDVFDEGIHFANKEILSETGV